MDTATNAIRRNLKSLLPIAIFGAAFLPRLVALGRYITPDELIWVYRSVVFREALMRGAWADTLVSGHPGVVTTWLEALGIGLQMWLRPSSQIVYTWITQLAYLTPDNMAALQQLSAFLSVGRILVAFVTSLGIVVIYWLLRPFLGTLVAFFAALLLAWDPFVIGLSGILHVDALMATFVIISLLALLLVLKHNLEKAGSFSPGLLILSGMTASWAILTKTPALLILPFAALILCVPLVTGQDQSLKTRVGLVIKQGLVWGMVLGVTTAVSFPALWSSPQLVLATLSGNATRHVEEALRPTFFMGTVAFDHGAIFYPVTLAWRLGPIVFLGLFVWAFALWRRRKTLALSAWLFEGSLLLWVVLFIGGISFAAKKFDRYILAVIPALTILAALGWGYWRMRGARRKVWLTTLVGLQFAYLLFFMGYPLAAYNPLVGGPFSAVYIMPLGWGESISASGRWLADLPEATEQRALTGIPPSLAPFFPGETLLAANSHLSADTNMSSADYVIFTRNSRQVDAVAVDAAMDSLELARTIRFGGLEQGWIYANPNPQSLEILLERLPVPISFADRVDVSATGLTMDDDAILVRVEWGLLSENGRYTVKIDVRDALGNVWQTAEADLLNAVYFYPEHWLPGERPQMQYVLNLPRAAPPGTYFVDIALVDTAVASQLPIRSADGDFLGVSYTVGAVERPQQASWPSPAQMQPDIIADADWADDALRLVGHTALWPRVATGSYLPLEMIWQAAGELPSGVAVALQLGDLPATTLPLSQYDSAAWRLDEVVATKMRLQIPADVPAGFYPLKLHPVLADGIPLAGQDYTLGEIEVQTWDRLFELPPNMQIPLAVQFGSGVYLRGMDGETAVLTPGQSLPLTLYWQTDNQEFDLLSSFVHLVAADGEIVAQIDRWPGGLPSDTWVPGQVIVDEYTLVIPADVTPGEYQIAVGLYTAADGQRLAAADLQGNPFADDRFILPLAVTISDSQTKN